MKLTFLQNIVVFLVLLSSSLFAQIQDTCYVPTAKAELNANNARVNFSLMGYLWSDVDYNPSSNFPFNSNSGYEIPKITDSNQKSVNSIFTGGFWIAGLDKRDSIRIASSTYAIYGSEDFIAGPIDNGQTDSATCNAYDKYWTINDSSIQKQINNYVLSNYQDIPLANIPTEILEWPAKGNPYAKGKNGASLTITDDLAPFIDVDSNGLYNPVKGDFPNIRGNQHIFWVFNDLGRNWGHNPENIGLEIHGNAFAYSSEIEAINNTTFYSFTFHSKDTTEMHDMYIGIFVDNDLGCFNNDYVGCDTIRNMGIAYNGKVTDPDCGSYGYGTNPPLVGVKILDNLACEEDSNQLTKMHAFKYYNGDASITGQPSYKEDYYNYLQGLWQDGTPQTVGGNAYGGITPTNYMFSGNPNNPNAWSECSEGIPPADRRFVMSLGPFDFKPDDVKKIDFTVVWTRPDSFYCGDFNSTIGLAADQAQAFYDSIICPARKIPVVSSVPSYSNYQLTVYPNPFQDKIHIEISKIDKDYSYQLLDISGKKVKSLGGLQKHNSTIATNELNSGIYFLQLVKNNNVIAVQKLVKTIE